MLIVYCVFYFSYFSSFVSFLYRHFFKTEIFIHAINKKRLDDSKNANIVHRNSVFRHSSATVCLLALAECITVSQCYYAHGQKPFVSAVLFAVQ